ncbi:MAG: hypothetical protein A4E26_01519 [Methanobacterium sp. PtaU1.Bin097]|nr:MAG: hypothetical protein A4E26_01519 [Methanobacterium sp. PtaU1.Bin097]
MTLIESIQLRCKYSLLILILKLEIRYIVRFKISIRMFSNDDIYTLLVWELLLIKIDDKNKIIKKGF